MALSAAACCGYAHSSAWGGRSQAPSCCSSGTKSRTEPSRGHSRRGIRSIRHLDDRHHLTLVCQDFAQLGQFVHVDNHVFRAVKAATPGSCTFILPAIREVPRRLQHPGKKTVGVRGRRATAGKPCGP
jgi:tRNA A37 threonylcarbamoyladenosine synthetase subunit TsaC/SUA5/YrdC